MAQRSKRQILKTLHLPADLHERIKNAAQDNNRKIIDELRIRFPVKGIKAIDAKNSVVA
jgi:hypothetical protein